MKETTQPQWRTTMMNKETKQMTGISCMDITHTYMAEGDTRDVSFGCVEVRFICSAAQSSFLAPFRFVIKPLSQDHALHFCWLGIQI